MKDIPVIEPKEIITTITNMKTGEVYKDDSEWKAKNIPESDIRKDVRVIMPSLDLFGETKQNRQMAITRAQQAKQMLQNGGMLVQPGFGGMRQGYRGDDAYGGSEASKGDGPAGGDKDGGREQYGAVGQYEGRKGTTDKGDDEGNVVDKFLDFVNPVKKVKKGIDFLSSKFGPKTKGNLGIEGYNMANIAGPVQRDFGPEDSEGGSGLFAPITSSAPVTSAPDTSDASAVSPSTGMNLNRIAYRLMADGGAVMDDEPRQAYGLGSIVKKATRAVKKVAKSDIGKAAIAAAGIYYLGGGGNPFTAAGRGSFSFGNLPGAGFFTGTGASVKAKAASLGLSPQDYMRGIGGKTSAPSFLGSLGLGGKAALGIGALSALPLLGVGVEEEEEQQPTSPYLGEGLDIAAIRANPRKFQGQAYRLMSSGGDTEDAKTEQDLSEDPNYKGWVKIYEANPDAAMMNEKANEYLNFYERDKTKQAEGSKEPVAKKVMPLIDMDGKEKDYRETGGFVDMGRMEKADDVPARLSKNEFVFTADAVRNAGDGSVDKGAEVMYNMMKNLEAGGEVSEESQGLEGARRMFQTSQRLEEVL